jgi:arylsulfatase A-like enzyme
MDRNVGRLLDWLEAAGLRENTLVVFTSDNGMNMGHHGVYGKGNATFPLNMFEESVKVPFIVSQPGIVPQGGVCAELLSHYDFLPTILEYSGTPAPDLGALPGGSFAPLLRGEEFRGREQVVICDEYGPVRMVRTKHWKYIHRYAYGPNELYDLRNDPSEKANLAGEPACQAKVAEMRARLEEWFLRYSEPCRDGLREAVTGSGQVGLVGPAGAGMNAFCDVRVRHVLPGAPKAK